MDPYEPRTPANGPAPPLEVRVLLLDDSEDDLFAIGRQLQRASGLSVRLTTAGSMEEGLRRLVEAPVDLVLVDFLLGAHTGTEVVDELRRAGWRGPVVVVTGHGAESVALAALRAGAADYLRKEELDSSTLERAVLDALEKGRLRRELEEKNRELERTVDSLRHRQREIQSFYHTLSHELRTPLTSTGEFLALVLEGFGGDLNEDQRRYLEIARRNCQGMARSLDDILDASRLETGKLSIHRAPTGLAELLGRVRACYEQAARRREVELAVDTGDADATAHVDEERVFQILSNLVSNALKFTPAGGRVEVRLGGDDEELTVEVRDTGRGIAPADLEAVFERSYQARAEDSGVLGGLGIGLYICRQLARLHGGDIRLTSVPGSGSRFVLHLPRVQEETPWPVS